MAKSTQADSPDSRILEIAAAHIRKFGLRRTTVVAIAQDAGMSHANVYRYFPSKNALVEAVSEHWLRPVESLIRDISDGPDPAYDKLERIANTIFSAYREKLETDPNIFAIFAEATEKGLESARKHRNRLQGEFQRIIEDGIASGAFPNAEQRRAIALVFDSLHRFHSPGGRAAGRASSAGAAPTPVRTACDRSAGHSHSGAKLAFKLHYYVI